MSALFGEAQAVLPDGRILHLVMNNPAWWAVEATLDQNYLETIEYLARTEQAQRPPQNRVMAALLFGATRANHAELSLTDCGDLMRDFGKLLGGPLGEAINGAIPWKDAAPGEAEPAKVPAKKKPGTGKKS